MTRAALSSQMQEAEEQREAAETALDEANAARAELEEQIAGPGRGRGGGAPGRD